MSTFSSFLAWLLALPFLDWGSVRHVHLHLISTTCEDRGGSCTSSQRGEAIHGHGLTPSQEEGV